MALTLKAAIREDEKAKRLLKRKLVPAIVYGPDRENIKIQIPHAEITSVLERAKETTPIHLVVEKEGGKEEFDVFIKSIQRHKVTTKVIHADFYEPEKGKVMHFRIPLKFVGEPIGVKAGGMLEEIIQEIEIRVLPKDLIEEIEVDVSHLNIGDVIRVEDLNIPETMKVLTDSNEVVVGVKAPRAEEVAVVEEEATEEIEPEAIKEKSSEEEE